MQLEPQYFGAISIGLQPDITVTPAKAGVQFNKAWIPACASTGSATGLDRLSDWLSDRRE